MHIPKEYFHDRVILLFISINAFLALLNTLLVLLRLDSSTGSYIVQYRANLGLSAFQAGDSSTLVSFVLFGFIVFALQVVLSIRAYNFHRQFSVVILAMSSLILLLSIIVANALLALR